MRLINLIGLFLLLLLFQVEGRISQSDNPGKELCQHPRLLFSKQEEQRVRDLFGTEPLLDSLRASLMREAERLLLVPPQEDPRRKIKNTKDILPVSREQVYRMVNLALAYRLSGDRRFAEKAERELIHVCNFSDWDPVHYLDVAEMTTAVAIGYDWLYDVLAPSTRQLVVHSIKTKALILSLRNIKWKCGILGRNVKRIECSMQYRNGIGRRPLKSIIRNWLNISLVKRSGISRIA